MSLTDAFKRFFEMESILAEQTAPSANVMSYLESVGVVESPIRIRKKGRIRLCGVYWFANANSDRIIAIGEEVRIVGRQGVTLIVEPINQPNQLHFSWPEDRLPKSC